MDPLTKEHNIKVFKIESLFNDRDIEINFDKNFFVLLGENGLGKTSLLNALYFTLTGRFSKLNSLVFKKISIEFNSGKRVEIERDDIVFSDEEDRIQTRQESRIIEAISQVLSEHDKELIAYNIDEFGKNKDVGAIINRLGHQLQYPTSILRRTVLLMFSGKSAKLEEARRTILKEVDADVLYFPTYRRIEEECIPPGCLKSD